MKWKLPILLIFSLLSLTTYAEKPTKRAVLMLKGVVPLRVGVGVVKDHNGALVPTLRTNAASGSPQSIKLKTSRAPASFGEVQRVVIESN